MDTYERNLVRSAGRLLMQAIEAHRNRHREAAKQHITDAIAELDKLLEERAPPTEHDIERLAEVAHHANIGEGGGRPHPWEDQPEIYQELMRRIARAVLEAMGGGPPAEEPDGSQCDTCDEYSDACDCVCAVEELSLIHI